MALLFALFLLQTTVGPTCADAADCRAQAEAAAARHEYETFHDLAWRAVQKGHRNDPDLMFLLARAQSLSGRPDDALVMLERLADMGVHTDAATNPDFARVRQLARWSEVATKLGASPASTPVSATNGKSASEAPAPDARPSSEPRAAEAKTTSPPPGAPSESSPPPATARAARPVPSAPAAEPPALSFDAPALSPVALAHDAVSRRFVLGDRSSRLFIVDEVSHHLVNYASAATAGFYDELTGFVIDARRGDLWVVSAKGHGADASSLLHKIQLVSGRTLMEVLLPDDAGATRLVDVTVTPEGTVYAVDEVAARLFRVRPGGRRLEEVMKLPVPHPTALTAVDDHVLYVAADGGLLRVDLTANKSARVKSVEDLTQFVSLSWRAGSLVGVERVAESYLVVRIALEAGGTRALPRAILAASPQPTVGTLTPQGFFYLAESGVIRLVKLR